MKRSIILYCITFFFIFLYLYTGGNKFMHLHLFRQQMIASPLLGSVAGLVAWTLPIMEFIVAVLLFLPVTRLGGLYTSLGLMSLFTIYLVGILFADSHLSCSCGGIVEELSPRQHLLFNGACICLSILGIILYKKEGSTIRFRLTSLIGTILLFLFIGRTFYSALAAKEGIRTGMEGRLLPSFDIQLVDSVTNINTREIPNGKPFIIIGFSPYCRHCQQETMDIIKNMDKLKNVPIYMLTTLPYHDMKKYYDVFQLSGYPNITMARDSATRFLSYFKATGIPYVAVFDAKKRLKEVIPGKVKIELLTKSLFE